MLYWSRTLLLAPLLIWQGLRARRKALLLPEPPGERIGVAGSGPALRLLIVGDSAAAGVGAEHQREALLGLTVAELKGHFVVHWRLEARSGATTGSTLRYLRQLAPQQFDVATTSLGVNDITSGKRLGAWLKQQAELRDLLRSHYSVRHIVVAGMPPVHLFPALPQPLRWHLGLRALQFDRALRRAVTAEDDCSFIALPATGEISDMAADGFHPGPGIYRRWARLLADCVRKAPGIA